MIPPSTSMSLLCALFALWLCSGVEAQGGASHGARPESLRVLLPAPAHEQILWATLLPDGRIAASEGWDALDPADRRLLHEALEVSEDSVVVPLPHHTAIIPARDVAGTDVVLVPPTRAIPSRGARPGIGGPGRASVLDGRDGGVAVRSVDADEAKV